MGGAFGAGFSQGLNQSMQQAQDKELKKIMLQKAKADIEHQSMVDRATQEALNSDDPRAILNLATLTKQDPIKLFVAQQMFRGVQPQQSQQPNIGMNYDEPTTPQMTFSPQQTGAPVMPGLDIDTNRIIAHQLYGQTTNPADITGSDTLLHPETQIPMKVPRDRRGYRWDLAQPVPIDVEYKPGMDELGNPTLVPRTKSGKTPVNVAPIRQPVENVYKEATGAGGEQGLISPPKYAKPQLGPKPGQPIQFDNKETLDEYVKTFGGKGGGMSIPTKPSETTLFENTPVKDNASLWVEPFDYRTAKPNQNPKELLSQKFKLLSTKEKETMDATKSVDSILAQVESMLPDVFGKRPTSPTEGTAAVAERGTGGIGRWLGAKSQANPKATKLASFIAGTLAPTIRSLGEKGTLASMDVERAANLMQGMTDTGYVAYQKLDQLKDLFQSIRDRTMGIEGRQKVDGKTYLMLDGKWYTK